MNNKSIFDMEEFKSKRVLMGLDYFATDKEQRQVYLSWRKTEEAKRWILTTALLQAKEKNYRFHDIENAAVEKANQIIEEMIENRVKTDKDPLDERVSE